MVVKPRKPRPKLPPIRILDAEESRAFIDARTRELLGMNVDEFERKLKAGEFENPDRSSIIHIAILLGLA